MPAPWLQIGKVKELLRPEFGDVAISKIRYLEKEGLLNPDRSPSGFRRYTKTEVERLRYILRVQKDNYLPLKVIRANLELIDQGIEPPAPEAHEPPTTVAPDPAPSLGGTRPPVRLTREELLTRSGLAESALVEMERQQIIRLRRGQAFYGWEALTLAVIVARFTPWGINTRQVRALKSEVDRQVELILAASARYAHRPDEARRVRYEIAEAIMQAQAALLQVGLDHS